MTSVAKDKTNAVPRALELVNAKRTLIIGHRGYPHFAPENTLPSWKLSIEAGADLQELDYYHTKDGKLVVIHDGTYNRTTDAKSHWGTNQFKIAAKSYDEIKGLDAGNWFSPQFKGTHLPLLEEAIDLIQGKGSVTLIERKEGDAATCVNFLHEKHLINEVVVQAFDWQYLKNFHDLEPQQFLGALGPPKLLADGSTPDKKWSKTLDSNWIKLVEQSGAKAAVWDENVTAAAVREAHRRGLKVWVYTINEPAKANKLLDMGVDGLITNNTSLMWKTLALRGKR